MVSTSPSSRYEKATDSRPAALNSFMSLAAVLTLDLSKYGGISMPRDIIVDALHQVCSLSPLAETSMLTS